MTLEGPSVGTWNLLLQFIRGSAAKKQENAQNLGPKSGPDFEHLFSTTASPNGSNSILSREFETSPVALQQSAQKPTGHRRPLTSGRNVTISSTH